MNDLNESDIFLSSVYLEYIIEKAIHARSYSLLIYPSLYQFIYSSIYLLTNKYLISHHTLR